MKTLLSTAALILVSSWSNAGVIAFEDFRDLSAFTLNGDAERLNRESEAELRLTSGLRQSSSAFLSDSVSLDNLASFSAAFDFRITNNVGISDIDGKGADGLTFVVHSNSNTVGGSGGGLGYKDLDNSVAVELDTWRNGKVDGRDGNHVGINKNGNLKSLSQTPIETRMNNGNIWSVWVDYNGLMQTLEVRLSEDKFRPAEATTFADLNLSNILGTSEAYIGFTSGTGSAGGDHNILNFEFYDDYRPVARNSVPEPSSLISFVLAMGLIMVLRTSNKF